MISRKILIFNISAQDRFTNLYILKISSSIIDEDCSVPFWGYPLLLKRCQIHINQIVQIHHKIKLVVLCAKSCKVWLKTLSFFFWQAREECNNRSISSRHMGKGNPVMYHSILCRRLLGPQYSIIGVLQKCGTLLWEWVTLWAPHRALISYGFAPSDCGGHGWIFWYLFEKVENEVNTFSKMVNFKFLELPQFSLAFFKQWKIVLANFEWLKL